MEGLVTKVLAQTGGNIFQNLNNVSTNASGINTVGDLITKILAWLIYIAGILAFAYLVYSGILYITAAGNPDQAKKGQQGLINAVIGIIIIALAYTILAVVSNTASGGLNTSGLLPRV